MKIILQGRIPSKKNSVNIIVRNGRVMKFPSNTYRAWHKEAENQMWGKIPKEPVSACAVIITIFAPDKRASDLTNKAESIMDFLVDMKVLEDDNWFVCGEVHLIFGGVDKENPRAVIDIMVNYEHETKI